MSVVTRTDHEGVWVLALSRPPVNPIDLSVVEAFNAEVSKAAATSACAGVVITGQGRAFSAGIDVKAVPTYNAATLRRMVELVNATVLVLYGMPKPTVAAVNGAAIGAGLVLALACDVRLAAAGTYALGLTEVTAGIPFPAAPMVVVQAELDRHVARDLVLTGRVFQPSAPVAAVVFDEVCQPDALLSTAIERARSSSRLPAYGTVKQQFKAEALARLRDIVERHADPMLQSWL
jgi:enoyl-CoA hydratase